MVPFPQPLHWLHFLFIRVVLPGRSRQQLTNHSLFSGIKLKDLDPLPYSPANKTLACYHCYSHLNQMLMPFHLWISLLSPLKDSFDCRLSSSHWHAPSFGSFRWHKTTSLVCSQPLPHYHALCPWLTAYGSTRTQDAESADRCLNLTHDCLSLCFHFFFIFFQFEAIHLCLLQQIMVHLHISYSLNCIFGCNNCQIANV